MFNTPTDGEKAHIVSSLMQTEEGRLHIANKMMPQIQKERDYVSFGREALVQDVLGQGEIPYYDVDVKTSPVVIPKQGEIPQIRVGVQRVEVPIFPVVAYPLIPIEDTKLRRFNVLERTQVKTRADLAEEEDRLIFGDLTMTDPNTADIAGRTQNRGARLSTSLFGFATSTTATDPNNVFGAGEDAFTGQGGTRTNSVVASHNGVTKEFLTQLYAGIIAHDNIPAAFIFNPVDYTDMLYWGRDDVDPETQKEVLDTGRMGKIWGCDIQISKIMPKGKVYCRASDQCLGVMPILIDLEVMDAPDPRSLCYGFAFYEFIGMAVLNRWGISYGTVDSTGI